MSGADYLEGVLLFLPMLAGALVGAASLQLRRFPQLTGADRAVVVTLLAVLGVIAIHLVPMLFGVLERWTPLVATGAWLLFALRVPAVDHERDAPRESAAEDRLTLLAVLAGGALLVVYGLAVTRARLTEAPVGIDALSFHLPTIGSWMKEGTLWQIPVFLPQVSPGHYPNHGDVVLMSTLLPWENDWLTHLTLYPVWAMLWAAVYALARELGAPRSASIVAGALVLAIPAVSVAALVAELVDVLMLFMLAAGLLLLVRHHRSGRTSELVLAGMALGISFGTKWYGVSSVAIVIGVWALARLVAGRPLREVVVRGVALVGVVAGSGGIWLLRNLVESGNPVHPVKVELLGVTLFDAPPDVVRERGGWTIADYLTDWDAWSDYILPQFRDALAAPAALLLVGLVLGTILAFARRRRAAMAGSAGLVLAGAAMSLLIVAVYSITPYTAGGPKGEPLLVGADSRYVVPALLIAAPIAAWAAGLVRRGPLVFALLGAVAVADGVQLTVDGERSSANLVNRDWAAGVGGALVICLLLWAAPRVWRSAQAAGRVRMLVVGVAAAAAVAFAAVGHVLQDSFNERRYLGRDETVDWIIDNAPSGQRIGLTGLWNEQGLSPVWPAFGPRLGNEVEYVGYLDDDTIQRYPDRRSFLDAVRRGGYDLLVIGRGRAGEPSPPEPGWAQEAGFEPLAESDRLALFRVT